MAQVLGQFPSFIAVYEGPDLCCVFANEAAKAIVAGREFVGLPLREALPEFVDQGIAALVEGVYESGVPARAREWRGRGKRPRPGRAGGGDAPPPPPPARAGPRPPPGGL